MNFDQPLDRPRARETFPTPVRWAFAIMPGMLNIAIVLILVASHDAPAGVSEGRVPAVSEATAELIDVGLPMEVNERVDRWIRRFVGQDREVFEGYLVREGLYGAMIRDRLRSKEMPEELLYLAMIESGFSATATSSMSASGVWQFMGPTAREYGLTVDYWVDERRDPVRATDAALDYLQELHDEFGSWYLAAAAYNSGPGRVARAIERYDPASVNDDELYWKISDHLPLETRNYVPRMLAATLLAQEAERYGFEVEKSLPYLFDQVLVPGGTPLQDVAEALDVPRSLIRELNPHLIRGSTPPGRTFMVRIPEGDSNRLVAELDGGPRAGQARRGD